MPYVYRKLSPNSIGMIEYGTSLFTYFSIFGMLGIYNYGIREISRVRNVQSEVNRVFNALFSIGILSNLCVAIGYYLLVLFAVHDTTLKTILFLLGINLMANIFNIEWFNEANEEFKFITIKSIIVRCLSVLAIFLLIENNNDTYLYVIITVIVLLINNIVSFIYAKKRLVIQFSFQSFTKVITPLLWILVLNNTFILYGNLDKTFLGIYAGEAEVAYYSVANKIMTAIYTSVMVLMYVSYPKLSFYAQNDYVSYKRELSKMVRYTSFLVMPISVFLYMLSKEIILLFAGEQYIGTIQPLRFFAIYMIITSFTSIFNHQVMLINRREKKTVLFCLICGIINSIGLLIFRDTLNSSLVILITTLSECILVGLMAFYAYKKMGILSEVFAFCNLKYLILSLAFIPIILLIKYVFINSVIVLLLSILICILFYFIMLYSCKDFILQQIGLVEQKKCSHLGSNI